MSNNKNKFYVAPFSASPEASLPSFGAVLPSREEDVSFADAVRSLLYKRFLQGALVGFFLGVMIVLTLLEIPGSVPPIGMILFAAAALGGLLFYFIRLFALLLAEQK